MPRLSIRNLTAESRGNLHHNGTSKILLFESTADRMHTDTMKEQNIGSLLSVSFLILKKVLLSIWLKKKYRADIS
jgi:hypothetical protein